MIKGGQWLPVTVMERNFNCLELFAHFGFKIVVSKSHPSEIQRLLEKSYKEVFWQNFILNIYLLMKRNVFELFPPLKYF